MRRPYSKIQNNQLKHIKKLVDEYFDINIADRTRKREYVMGRMMFFKLCKEYQPKTPFIDIGGIVNQDHSSVVHGLKKIQDYLETEEDTRADLLFLQNEIYKKIEPMGKGPFSKYLGKEDHIQHLVMTYLNLQYPNVYAIHVPNEGKRTPFERFKFKYLGGKAGIPDVLIFRKVGEFNGLAIELKAPGNKPTPAQYKALNDLKDEGWNAVWCVGFEEAKETIDQYLKNVTI